MPGFYGDDDYDVAGFILGVVDSSKLIDGKAVSEGDVLIGLPSVGLHTNGYSSPAASSSTASAMTT
jgi:phosphoribosylformylglycinamidine cyclo-ligase